MSPFSLSCMVAFCSAIALIVLSLRLNARAALNRAMAWLAFCYALWALGEAVVISAPNVDAVGFFDAMAAVGYVYGAAAYLTLSLVFAGATPRVSFILNLLVYLLASVEAFRSLTGEWVISGYRAGPWGNVGILSTNEGWGRLDAALHVAVLAASTVAILRARAASHSRRFRSIALYVLIGAFLIAIGEAFCVEIAWQLWGYPDPSVLVGVVGIALDIYLIERYRFLSLDHPRIEREVLGAVEDAVLLFDSRLLVIRANQGARLALARGTRALPGLELPSIFAESDSILRAWEAVVAGKDREIRTRCSIEGEDFVMTLSPILDEFGDLIGGMAIVRKQDSLDAAVAAFGITARERSIILMLMQGITNKEIADALFIAPNTVKNHIANIYQKTGAGTRVELFRLILGGSSASK
ncbi:MAG TPA: LuxR C-terminal-related transcriptional regulator [Rectinemataceae bacterium]|nr:LuxR C-terminal-related transcriptional regulator [Rectinemataceae bacterium]